MSGRSDEWGGSGFVLFICLSAIVGELPMSASAAERQRSWWADGGKDASEMWSAILVICWTESFGQNSSAVFSKGSFGPSVFGILFEKFEDP